MPQFSKVPTETPELSGNSWSQPPAADQLEVTLFGPGFGECAVLHVGSDRWIVVDSCQSSQERVPAALEYLTSLGRDPARCVELIVATHWHDDHIRGMGALLNACPNAAFTCSAAIATPEFEAMVLAFDRQRMVAAGSGVREINAVFNTPVERQAKSPRLASASKKLLRFSGSEIEHKRSVEVTALSPSDHEQFLALEAIGKMMPKPIQTQYRCPSQQPNHMSIALIVEIGETGILLGADLEYHQDVRRGWAAVVADSTLPKSSGQHLTLGARYIRALRVGSGDRGFHDRCLRRLPLSVLNAELPGRGMP